MASRTYIPTLKIVAKAFCKYVQRYQEQLNSRLSPTAQTALAAALDACMTLADLLPVDPIGP